MNNGCGEVRVVKNVDACLQGALSYQGEIGRPVLEGATINLSAEILQSGFIAREAQRYLSVGFTIEPTPITYTPSLPEETTWLIVAGHVAVAAIAGIVITFNLIDPTGTSSGILSHTTTGANEFFYIARTWPELTRMGAFKHPWAWSITFAGGGVGESATVSLYQHEVVNGLALQT